MRAPILLAALALCAGCTSLPFVGAGAPNRPACSEPPIVIYFTPESDAVPQAAAPLIAHAREAVAQCRAQGGTLRRVVVRAYPDAGETGPEADRAALARAEAVVAALVEAGLPGERVVAVDYRRGEHADPTHIMRRHADISFDMR